MYISRSCGQLSHKIYTKKDFPPTETGLFFITASNRGGGLAYGSSITLLINIHNVGAGTSFTRFTHKVGAGTSLEDPEAEGFTISFSLEEGLRVLRNLQTNSSPCSNKSLKEGIGLSVLRASSTKK